MSGSDLDALESPVASPGDILKFHVVDTAMISLRESKASLREFEQSTSPSSRQHHLKSALSCMSLVVDSYNELAKDSSFGNGPTISNDATFVTNAHDFVVNGLAFFRCSQESHYFNDNSSAMLQHRHTVSHFVKAVNTLLQIVTPLGLDPDCSDIMSLKYLGHVLSEYFKPLTGQVPIFEELQVGQDYINKGDVDKAHSHFTRLANSCPHELYPHPDRFRVLDYLGYTLGECFKRDRARKKPSPAYVRHREGDIHSGDRHYAEGYLKSAITHLRSACGLQANLTYCRSLGRAYLQLLDTALRWLEPVRSDASFGEYDRAIVEFDLSWAYSELYEMESNITHITKAEHDLEEAIEASQKCFSLLSKGSYQWPIQQSRVASLLLTRFGVLRHPEDLKEALDLHSQASSRRREIADIYQPKMLLEYARALHAQWQTRTSIDGNVPSPEQIISITNKVFDHCSAINHPDRITAQINLSEYLCDAYSGLKQDQTLADAENHLNLVTQNSPDMHPLHAHRLRNMAIISFHKKAHDLAFDYFSQATDHQSAAKRERFRICMAWSTQVHFGSLYDSDEVEGGVQLLYPDVGLQWEFLRLEQDGFASYAATLAINEGNVKLAVEILEHGRNLIWSAMGRNRTSLDELQESDPILFEKLQKNASNVEYLALSMSGSAVIDDHIRRRDEYLKEQKDLLSQVRSLPGHHGFGRRVRFEDLRKAADEGAVIIVNTSSHSTMSHAIIVHASADPVAIPLPRLGPKDVENLVGDLEKAQESASMVQKYTYEASKCTDMERPAIEAKVVESENAASGAFKAILLRLWDDLVHPVEEHLGPAASDFNYPSRIWWCVTGELCALPVHAAAMCANLSNLKSTPYYLASYTSSLTALITARQSSSHRGELDGQKILPSLLLIGGSLRDDEPDGESCVEIEFKRIKRFIASTEEIDFSSHDDVINSLPRHPWVHFACHGGQDMGSPFNSCLYRFSNIKLTLLDIMQARLSNAELAVLSACRTATDYLSRTPDETLHVARGLQFCGYKSAVGTLWEVMDEEDELSIPKILVPRCLAISINVPRKNLTRRLEINMSTPGRPFSFARRFKR
ncbi:CHAT domain-containing protein [Mycena rosella]|uniref:CHAT domain-containing protein n=1 Tax=Mycena rosella TaxID=1033263 RepID=A0AAD7GLN8_MYCRO|nr:CHAT domain-containing protein [Mycena rosella]